MINSNDTANKLAIDASSLNNIKLSAKENSPEAIKAAAKQFEALFLNMVMKSMRAATASSEDNPFDNEQSRQFTAMLDQQLSNNLSGKGLGLAEVLTRQLSKVSSAIAPESTLADPSSVPEKPSLNSIPSILKSTNSPDNKANKTVGNLSQSSADFKNRMLQHAEVASQKTGVPAHLMLGQAALESGWGKREIKGQDGTNSHNLFGIKATGDWQGKVVETTTTEYINGVKQKRVEKFRAYDSYADSFKDFAQLIQNSPRYKSVMANLHSINSYAQAMQKSGYATDPHYASKLSSVLHKISV